MWRIGLSLLVALLATLGLLAWLGWGQAQGSAPPREVGPVCWCVAIDRHRALCAYDLMRVPHHLLHRVVPVPCRWVDEAARLEELESRRD